jgi:hypothetical protein
VLGLVLAVFGTYSSLVQIFHSSSAWFMDRYAGAPTIILVGASGSSTHYGEAEGDQKMRGDLPGPAAICWSGKWFACIRSHFFSFRLLLQDALLLLQIVIAGYVLLGMDGHVEICIYRFFMASQCPRCSSCSAGWIRWKGMISSYLCRSLSVQDCWLCAVFLPLVCVCGVNLAEQAIGTAYIALLVKVLHPFYTFRTFVLPLYVPNFCTPMHQASKLVKGSEEISIITMSHFCLSLSIFREIMVLLWHQSLTFRFR